MQYKFTKFNLYFQQIKQQLQHQHEQVQQDAGLTVGSVMGPASANSSIANTVIGNNIPVIHKGTQGVTVSDVKAIYTPAINKVKINKRKLKK